MSSLKVHLPNGVSSELSQANFDELTMLVQMLGRLPCCRFDEGLKVYLHRDPVDFHMGINGLSILVEQAMRLNSMTSALFVFGNRRRDGDRRSSAGAATVSGYCSSDSKPTASSAGRTVATRSRSAPSSFSWLLERHRPGRDPEACQRYYARMS
ncbi:IS66 family insertion sequence element accessory protein TnpB [Burkholderia glumae]|uniref:IS66 family insertion sequence element accessory protein TnpB n=1 Tax=Burkholderia glumae TaxID=337 RepID=UPI003B9F579F